MQHHHAIGLLPVHLSLPTIMLSSSSASHRNAYPCIICFAQKVLQPPPSHAPQRVLKAACHMERCPSSSLENSYGLLLGAATNAPDLSLLHAPKVEELWVQPARAHVGVLHRHRVPAPRLWHLRHVRHPAYSLGENIHKGSVAHGQARVHACHLRREHPARRL